MSYERQIGPLSLLIFVGISAGCAARPSAVPWPHQYLVAEKMTTLGIKDFGKVNDYLYRGAQPKPEGIEELKKLGIDTIVDLRGERHKLMEKERAHAESLGMRLVSIPGTGWTAPRTNRLRSFLRWRVKDRGEKYSYIAGLAAIETACLWPRTGLLSTDGGRRKRFTK